MKKLIFICSLLLWGNMIWSQDKGASVWYFDSIPDVTPSLNYGPELAFDYVNRILYNYNRSSLKWEPYGKAFYGSGVPTSDGSEYKAYLDVDTGKWYRYDGGWVETKGVDIDGTSSPVLGLSGDKLKLDFSLSTNQDEKLIADSLMGNDDAKNVLGEGLNPFVQAKTDSIKVRGVIEFLSSQTALKWTLAGDSAYAQMILNLSMYNLDPQQIDSLVMRILEESVALERLNDGLSQKAKVDTVTNSGGQDVMVKYTGKKPTFTGNNGIFDLGFDRDSTGLEAIWFGGDDGDNVWDGSGDLFLDINVTGSGLNTNFLNEYFGNVQLVSSGNNEVLSDPKEQANVAVFQESLGGGVSRILLTGVSTFGSNGFKLVITF
jgi:hypothetical protein